MNAQISAWPISANAASSIQNPKPLLVNQESIKMATKIEQFSYAAKVAALTHQYLELGLPLNSALRAAEADLWEPENLGLVIQSGPSSTKRCNPIRKDILPPNVREYPASSSSISLEGQQL